MPYFFLANGYYLFYNENSSVTSNEALIKNIFGDAYNADSFARGYYPFFFRTFLGSFFYI